MCIAPSINLTAHPPSLRRASDIVNQEVGHSSSNINPIARTGPPRAETPRSRDFSVCSGVQSKWVSQTDPHSLPVSNQMCANTKFGHRLSGLWWHLTCFAIINSLFQRKKKASRHYPKSTICPPPSRARLPQWAASSPALDPFANVI